MTLSTPRPGWRLSCPPMSFSRIADRLEGFAFEQRVAYEIAVYDDEVLDC